LMLAHLDKPHPNYVGCIKTRTLDSIARRMDGFLGPDVPFMALDRNLSIAVSKPEEYSFSQ